MANTGERHPVSRVYRIFFTWIDQIVGAIGLLCYLFNSPATLRAQFPTASVPIAPEIAQLFRQLVFAGAEYVLLEGILLRVRSHDTTVWRILQGVLVSGELLAVVTQIVTLASEGRITSLATWTPGEWSLFVSEAVWAPIRISCAIGIGMKKTDSAGEYHKVGYELGRP